VMFQQSSSFVANSTPLSPASSRPESPSPSSPGGFMSFRSLATAIERSEGCPTPVAAHPPSEAPPTSVPLVVTGPCLTIDLLGDGRLELSIFPVDDKVKQRIEQCIARKHESFVVKARVGAFEREYPATLLALAQKQKDCQTLEEQYRESVTQQAILKANKDYEGAKENVLRQQTLKSQLADTEKQRDALVTAMHTLLKSAWEINQNATALQARLGLKIDAADRQEAEYASKDDVESLECAKHCYEESQRLRKEKEKLERCLKTLMELMQTLFEKLRTSPEEFIASLPATTPTSSVSTPTSSVAASSNVVSQPEPMSVSPTASNSDSALSITAALAEAQETSGVQPSYPQPLDTNWDPAAPALSVLRDVLRR